jgi:Arc/MetJ-type ribon-helix-helix transcriptional regulator
MRRSSIRFAPLEFNPMNIALTDDLQQLLRRKVASGRFPDEAGVVKEALRHFLTEGTSQGHPSTSHTLELDQERLPGPFLEDETVFAPVDLPRPGQALARTAEPVGRRQPDGVSGE